MKLLIILAGYIALSSATLLGAKKCTWGPSYWCGSLKTANECGAFKHCLSAVWGKQKLTVVKDEVCDACKDAVQQVHDMLANKDTEKQIQDYLDQLCQTIPNADMAKECQQEVDQNFDQVIQMILNELNPDSVCNILGFCKQAQEKQSESPIIKDPKITHPKLIHVPLHKVQPPLKSSVKSAPQCVICEFVMKELDSMLSDNATEQEIIHALDQVCSVLPSTISQECKTFIDTYGPAVLQLLSQELSPAMVCTALGLCMGGEHISKLRDLEQCELCQLTVKYAVAILGKQSTQTEIKEALDKVCSMLPGGYDKSCESFIDKYEPTLIYILQQELKDPKEICELLHLCGNNDANVGLKLKPVADVGPQLKYVPKPQVNLP